MKWPWQHEENGGRLIIASRPDALAWVQADAHGKLAGCGFMPRGDEAPPEFTRRVRALNLPPYAVTAVLALAEAHFLQIEAPAVKPEEMKAAARWSVKDLVDGRIDEMTLDVMAVGDDRARAHRQMFVVAARNALIRDLCERAQGAGLRLAVIDVAETVQRNLLSAAAEAEGLGDRATAALMRHGEHCLLTICAGGELYYARRLDWDEAGFAPAAPVPTSLPQAMEGLDFVDYGDGADTTDELGAPRLVIELQRSFDVWERTWPDLPLARLWLEAGEASAALMLQLEQSLGLPVARLEPERLFPGFDQASGSPEVRAAILPLLGAMRRAETRRL